MGRDQGLLGPVSTPHPSPSPPNVQHSTNPANPKRILILEARRVHASPSQTWPGDARPCAPGLLALARAREPSLKLLSCFAMEGTACSGWRRERPMAQTHLEENQIGLKKEKEK